MGTYGINKLNYLLQEDPEFRRRMNEDPEATLAELALSDDERAAVLAGDVAWLYRAGAHTFLLSRMPRFLPGLIDRDTYIARLRATLSPHERAEVEASSRHG